MKTETDKELSKVMSIKNLDDTLLIQKTEGLVKEEREILTNLLHHFREIERRRLFCDYKFESLREMLVKHFGYSDNEAYRRISAMWLLKDVPEVEEKITNGELSLSHLSLAQSFFRKEAKIHKVEISKEDKLDLLTEISEQTIREAQRIMLAQSSAPEELRPDKVNVISENKVEFRFTANHSLETKISEVKGLLAHKHPSLSIGELFEVLCDITIVALKKEKTESLKKAKTGIAKPGNEKTEQARIETLKNHKPATLKTENYEKSKNESSAAPGKSCVSTPQTAEDFTAKPKPKSQAQINREVWQESHHACSNCGSKRALEIDHRHPKAKGGENSKENLRILCRFCNQRAAIKEFGQLKMDLYLNLRN